MFQLILMLIVVWICINSLWYQTFILVVFSSLYMETLRLIKKMQGIIRHRKQFVKRDIFVGQTPPALPYALLANRPTYPRHLWRCGPKLTRKTSKRNTASVLGASSSSISDHVLYHHQQQVPLFKEEVMKQKKLKLCFLHTKQSGRSSC